MFINKLKFYKDNGADLTNVEQIFDRKGPKPFPGLAPNRDFAKDDVILTFPIEFLITKEEMCKLPANAFLLKLEQQGEKVNFLDFATIWLHYALNKMGGKFS